MPLTSKGKKILRSMRNQYGPEKAEKVFYASKNKGKISGVDEQMETYKHIGYLLAEALNLIESETKKPKDKDETKEPKANAPKKPKERKPRYWQWLDDPTKRWWGPGPHPRDRKPRKPKG